MTPVSELVMGELGKVSAYVDSNHLSKSAYLTVYLDQITRKCLIKTS